MLINIAPIGELTVKYSRHLNGSLAIFVIDNSGFFQHEITYPVKYGLDCLCKDEAPVRDDDFSRMVMDELIEAGVTRQSDYIVTCKCDDPLGVWLDTVVTYKFNLEEI